MKIDEIKTVVQMMSEHDLTEFKIEAEEMILCIRRGSGENGTPVIQTVIPAPGIYPAIPLTPTISLDNGEAGGNGGESPAAVDPETIDAPIVGTFYRASSPDADSFVEVGIKVTSETVVCIIEAMKVMNEIKAEKSGTIKEILIENAQAVEFGQPLFIIE